MALGAKLGATDNNKEAIMNFKKLDRVRGWFGKGTVTDVPEFDNVVRIKQFDKDGKPEYRYVLKVDCERV